MPKKLLSPDAARDFLVRRFNNQHQNWLAGEGGWPLSVPLGMPTEKEVADDLGSVRSWVTAWASWKGAGEVLWEERQWARLGTQRLPASLVVAGPAEVATIVGQAKRWATAAERYQRMVARWPVLAQGSALTARFSVLADYSLVDYERLFSLLAWLESNPASNVYLRQLPVEGLDTKWFEQRTGVVAGLLRRLRGVQGESDFFELCGLRKPAHRVRLRLLCPELRRTVGGLRDIEAPADELATLPIAPGSAIIVENLDTGLALPDMPGTVGVMRLGNAVSALGTLPWLRDAKAVYWGDIDTFGFSILDRARRVLPDLRSVLMDEATLVEHRSLWGQESVQCPDVDLPNLHEEERAVYDALRANAWGQKVRLEQERLPWDIVASMLIKELCRG
jgi:hypothetical protein